MALHSRFKANDELYEPLATINVTPLVDVMLVLLIIFMITAPLLSAGIKINLPQAQAARPINPSKPIVVAIGKGGSISLGSEEVSADELIDRVRIMLGGDKTRVVYVRGDRQSNYGDVVAVVDTLETHGIDRIAILTTSPAQSEDRAAAHAVGARAQRGTSR